MTETQYIEELITFLHRDKELIFKEINAFLDDIPEEAIRINIVLKRNNN